ncbi:hypothetical protein JRO89_XS09G0096100 [Xanthoceras sorbifolium]|uniref:t-SNARE coiled-coil homology domain-containing protein n=1 Tax=Xanthoceras sorbifolium TaxID=99658 RepID=A0ABQ8HL08_9ROSI|nr:hypothetical protein JRO89_XS09G0096100 [Xanthoceras sorbifolium]
MASSSHRTGPGGYLEGLSTRPVAGSDEIQLRIDPINADLDDEITGLHSQVRQLRNIPMWRNAVVSVNEWMMVDSRELWNDESIRTTMVVAQDIQSEATFQRDFLDQLQMTLIKAQAGVKNNMRRLNKSIVKHGSNHIVHVVLFALLLFTVLYLWSKMFRR